MTTVRNELQQTLVKTVVGAQLFSALDLRLDFSWLKPVEGNLSLKRLPEERAECEHVDFLIVAALLKELGRHVTRSACELHCACS